MDTVGEKKQESMRLLCEEGDILECSASSFWSATEFFVFFLTCLNFSEKHFGKPLNQEKGTCVSKLAHQGRKTYMGYSQ